MNLQLYGRDNSYNVQKVLWFADELGLTLDHRQRGGQYGGLCTDEFVAMNPMQKVPVLRDRGRSIWESNTILRYLLAQYGGDGWRVEGAFQRTEYERWMDWAQSKFEPAFVGVFWGFYRTPEAQRDYKAIEQAVRECECCLTQLDQQLGDSAYLLGDSPSLADISSGVFLYRLAEIELPIVTPMGVQAWRERLYQRPAYQQWVMRDFTELAGRLAY